MLIGNEFVKAEDKYRRELLRDQYQSEPSGKVGKIVAILVVAGALLLAACGIPSDSNSLAGGTVEAVVTTEPTPAGDVIVVPAREEKTLEEEFSGVTAPDWHPKNGHLTVVEQTEETSGPR